MKTCQQTNVEGSAGMLACHLANLHMYISQSLKWCFCCPGLGPSAGQVWRVGLMGYNATAANIELVLTAFRQGLADQGYSKSQPKTQNPQEDRVNYQ